MLFEANQVLLVEDKQKVSFCTEDCIKAFFNPIKDQLGEREKSLRADLGLMDEPCLPFKNNPQVIKEAFQAPTRVFESVNELGIRVTSFLTESSRNQIDFSNLVSCLLYENTPSLILSHIVSASPKLIESSLIGKEGELVQAATDGSEELINDPEVLETVERLKSSYLAEMLAERSEADIPFENFDLYDEYIPQTLEDPDEIYQTQDDIDDEVYTYIRSFSVDQKSFYYFVLCIMAGHHDEDEEIMMPFISFPTVDGSLYDKFRKGERLHGSLKN